jgi:hypothetical protein
MFGRKRKSKPLYCSFCAKSSDAVKALIAGPSVHICDECVTVCNQVLRDEQKRQAEAASPAGPAPDWDGMSDDHLLKYLGVIAAAADSQNDSLHSQVGRLRARGVTWEAIGRTLGMSRQAAWERFS